MQWLPFPDSYNGPQILAVTCKRDGNKFMTYSNFGSETCSIQLWAYEKTSRSKTGVRSEMVTHLYSIAIDDGPVWDMKLCPSGGYSETERLGLLACTSASGKIYIYALPLVKDVQQEDDPMMIKLDPSLILDTGITAPCNIFSCKISWSRHKNHSLLAAGFSNGFIALWRLDILSPLLRTTTSVGTILTPSHIFPAHQEAVTCLVFHHSSHADYLLTGSNDRRLKVFQLNDDTQSHEIFNLKCPSRVSCGDWPANWIAFFYGCDSEFTFQKSELKLKNPNELGPIMDYGSLCNISSSVTDVAVNEWTDVIYFGSAAGDIHGCYRPNFLLTTGSEKTIERHVSKMLRLNESEVT